MTIEQQLRAKIKEVLATVTAINAPIIYKLIQSESGYKFIEEQLIEKCVKNNFTISACIPHIEREL